MLLLYGFHKALWSTMVTFSSSVNNIHSISLGLEAGDRVVNKTKPLPSWGLESSGQRRKSPYIWGIGGWYICVCVCLCVADLQRRILELDIEDKQEFEMEKARQFYQTRGRDGMACFWEGEEGDTFCSHPVPSISNSTFSPHQLSPGLLPPFPDTFPWLHSIDGSKSSSIIWHEGSAMRWRRGPESGPHWPWQSQSLFLLNLALTGPIRGQAVWYLLAFAHAGSFWLERPSFPSSLSHLSQQASFKPWQASPPWGSFLPFRAGASLAGQGLSPRLLMEPWGPPYHSWTIPDTEGNPVHAGSQRSKT